jgi:DNA-binding transcriptional LysR family regulator
LRPSLAKEYVLMDSHPMGFYDRPATRFAGWDESMNLYEEDLNLLVIFEAILETRSVSKASERLNMSQPSMSNALARLRKAFDDPMFIRVKNSMEPTPHALTIAEPVKQALALARSDIFRRQSFDAAKATQTFTLCMTDIAEAAYLPALINAMRRLAPRARLRTISPIAERLEEGLESGAVDLAIGYFPDIKDAGVFQQRLLRNSGFVCIINDQNPHLQDGKLTTECFTKALHAAIRTEGRSQEIIDIEMARLGIERQVFLTVPHFLGLLSIIPRTELMAIIPVDLAATFSRQEGIQVHPLPFESPSVAVTQVWHKRYDKDAANKWIRSMVKDALQSP